MPFFAKEVHYEQNRIDICGPANSVRGSRGRAGAIGAVDSHIAIEDPAELTKDEAREIYNGLKDRNGRSLCRVGTG